MSSDDGDRILPPHTEWGVLKDGTIVKDLIYGDYETDGRPKTRRDVDPSMQKPYLIVESTCSMVDGEPKYRLLEKYPSTDVAATEAGHARDIAQRERSEAQSAAQATYRRDQIESQAAHWTRQEAYLAKQQARREEQQARQEELRAQNERNLNAATVYTDGGRGKSSGGNRTEASSTLGGQQFGPGATPNFGTDEFGNEWGYLKSGEAPHLGKMDSQDDSCQSSQPGDTEATGSFLEKKPKVCSFCGLISTR
jgi:hypothetical protein